MAEAVLETERLILRRELPGDLEAWLEHMNTPQVMEKNGGVQAPEKVAEGFAKARAHHDEWPFLFVALKAGGMLIGKCGLAPIDSPEAPEALAGQPQIGWSLRADQWGRGYATEAAVAVLAMAFERFRHDRVYSQTSERNRGSWRIMQRLGMTRLAHLDYHDPEFPPEDNPTMVWGIEREAWQAARAAA
jgi:RimJ/RimL family protein N-acetyltransferase